MRKFFDKFRRKKPTKPVPVEISPRESSLLALGSSKLVKMLADSFDSRSIPIVVVLQELAQRFIDAGLPGGGDVITSDNLSTHTVMLTANEILILHTVLQFVQVDIYRAVAGSRAGLHGPDCKCIQVGRAEIIAVDSLEPKLRQAYFVASDGDTIESKLLNEVRPSGLSVRQDLARLRNEAFPKDSMGFVPAADSSILRDAGISMDDDSFDTEGMFGDLKDKGHA